MQLYISSTDRYTFKMNCAQIPKLNKLLCRKTVNDKLKLLCGGHPKQIHCLQWGRQRHVISTGDH